ncbi:MAG: thiamine phosphate synthase, partial [Dehalococcoidia bacterium]|nr:thiamine phosphate synthase [Dehalococcoidia bacterium]
MTPPLYGLYAIIDLDQTADPIALLTAALAGGARVAQLRAKGRDKGEVLAIADRMVPVCRAARALFIVNDHVDVALACDADGAHVGQRDLPVAVARALLGPDRIVGCSTNTVDEAVAAVA